jgi:hypothetical protein
MPYNEFQVRESSTGYRVELHRDGKPYVTFLDGLTRQARSLTALWAKISTPRATVAPALVPEKSS